MRPEVPFVLGLAGTVVRGQIDLLVAGQAGEATTVIDYKTDAVEGRSAAELGSRYLAQREVYGLAAGEAGRSGSRTCSSRRRPNRWSSCSTASGWRAREHDSSERSAR